MRETGFIPQDIRYLGFYDHGLPPRSTKKTVLRPLYWPFELAAATPLIQEVMCARIAALLRKK